MEVFHNFTLVHDDIMDEAPLRRGADTVHIKWDLPTAILSGDLLLIEAYNCWGRLPPIHYRLYCKCSTAQLWKFVKDSNSIWILKNRPMLPWQNILKW